MRATREAYGDALVELGSERENVVVLEADLAKSTYSIKFKEAFPKRFIECGVAEANMMGVAAGLAASNMIAYTGSFAIFATGRAFEQVRNTIAYASLNVKICPSHGGVTVGEDGGSHQSIEDVALMRVIPNMRVVVPADYIQARAAIKAAADIEGPVFIRTGRSKVPTIFDDGYVFDINKAPLMREGSDVTIMANGIMLAKALEAADLLLTEGIEAEIINVHTIKPLDEATIIASLKKTGAAVTAEEHSVIGGLGGAIAELAASKTAVPIEMVGIKDIFGTSGSEGELLEHFDLTKESIVRAAKEVIVRKA
ncbi:MAG: transketolase C-terminal domain-containing protein [Actinomycetota bacterium]|nr:transketolase C-terminal domain-containing protein [Actinomycetota bacterium]